LTSDGSSEAKRRALSNGARDFLIKPLSPIEVRLRIRNQIETRFLHLALQNQNQWLEDRVRERTAELTRRTEELEEARIEILERLARAAEFRDDETGLHTQRVGRTAAALAKGLGIDPAEVEVIRRAAPLHDIGKIGIPDAVLLKGGRLTAEEHAVMKTHTIIGSDILAGSNVPLLVTGREIALNHHEHWDGRGYPGGLCGDAIPLAARAVAVADVFDALTHPRPYKAAWTIEAAMEEILAQAGRQFDPEVARAFAALHKEGRMAEAAA
jgi:putative two-component system response regulator